MEQLTIKHLAPYLPYRLKVQYEGILNTKEFSHWKKENGKLDFMDEPSYPYPEEKRGLKIGFIKQVGVFKNFEKYGVGNLFFGLQTHYGARNFKPILRHLSDLTKDENFELYLELCEELGLNRCDHLLKALEEKTYYAFDISKYEIVEEFMYKNHFDWKFDLIKKGLAIDINTIKPTN